MDVRCLFGIHKWKAVRMVWGSGEHDWYAKVYGNVMIEQRCQRCGMIGRKVGYDPA